MRYLRNIFTSRTSLSAFFLILAAGFIASISIHEVDAKTKTERLGGSERYLTYLTTDKPIYRSGETVFLRGVMLSAHDHTPNNKMLYSTLTIKDPAGAQIHSGTTRSEQSVFGTTWPVPEGVAGGEYTATLSFPNDGYASVERKFDIRAYRNARITSQMEFAKKAYGPGEEVMASLNAKRAEGGIPKDAKVTAIARVDGKEVWQGVTTLDAKGNASVKFTLPAKIAVGEGSLVFVIEDGGTIESAAKTLPILLQKLDVQAYPEGGDLIAGLSSKVYFQAMTPWGDPADFEGTIVDAADTTKVLASVKSIHEGRASATFTPEEGKSYLLKISKPYGITVPVALPAVKATGVVISNTLAAYDADAPLEFDIASTSDQKIRIVASNYEKEIAAATLPVKAGVVRNVMLTPPCSAEGVIRLTLYDEDEKPLAERLVFRKPRKQLNIEVTANRNAYSPMDAVELTFTAKDDKGQPVTSAVLGVTVTDESVLEMIETRKQTARLPGLVFLESNVQKLEDARLYLSDDAKAPAALDLLLGTQGWRRFAFEDIEAFVAKHGDQGKRALAFRNIPKPIRYKGVGAGGGGAWGGRRGGMEDDRDGGRPENEGRAEEKAGAPDPNGAPKAKAAKQGLGKQIDRLKELKNHGPEQAKNEEVKKIAPAKAKKAPMRDPAPVADREAPMRKRRADAREMRRAAPYRSVRVYAHFAPKTGAKNLRTDFTETVYWNAGLVTDKEGKAKATFALSDSITTFKVSVDGFSQSGLLGTADHLLTSQEPFVVEPKLPLEVTAGDLVLAAMVFHNNTLAGFDASLEAQLSKGLSLDWSWDGAERARAESITVGAGARVADYYPIRVGDANGEIGMKLSAKAGDLIDRQERSIRVVPRGFPIEMDKSGLIEADQTLSFNVNIPEGVVPSSIRTEAKVYPTPLANLQEAVASLIRQPYGCFEQTSSVVYPMVMAQQYLTTHEGADVAMIAKARKHIEAGYAKLKSFECKTGGYEWFGRGAGHEALTAYGVVEFNDIAKVQGIDNEMLERTRKWLADRRDGSGGFKRNKKALDSFGGAPGSITNAYIVWSLVSQGQSDMLKPEIAALKEALKTNKDNYFRGLVAGVLYHSGDQEAAKVLAQELADAQQEDGSIGGAETSITRSRGNSLLIETTSIAMLSWLQDDATFAANTEKAIKWLTKRCQNGRFGSTQGTVLALKAILAYDDARAHPKAPGQLVVSIDGKPAQTIAFDTTTKGAINFDDLAAKLLPGNHVVTLQMVGGSKMPYSFNAKYFAETPASSQACQLHIETKLASDTVKEGEIVEVQVTLQSTSREGLATTMAIVGIPGGLEVRHDKLKELVKAEKIAFYEVIGRDVALYFRGMEPMAKVELSLDCVASVSGEYTGPASRTYLYYGDEHKHWAEGLFVTIKPRD